MLCHRSLKSVFLSAVLAIPALAAPVAKTVPASALNAATPHGALSEKATTLKGTSSVAGAGIQARWDFGDGSEPAVIPVTNQFDVSATHIYSGKPGTSFTATLTVSDTRTGESASSPYLVIVRDNTLQAQVDAAVDEALWYLHTTMTRASLGANDGGGWRGACYACDDTGSADATNLLAFEASGFLPSGDPANPYTETVSRALNTLFDRAGVSGMRSADWLAAIAAANTPDARAVTGPSDISGHTYREILDQAAANSPAGAVTFSAPGARAQDAQTLLSLVRANRAVRTPPGNALLPQSARMLVDRQNPAGYWAGNNPDAQAALETAQSVLILRPAFTNQQGPSQITNVSSSVKVTGTGLLYNRITRLYNGTLTVTNTSGSALTGPLNVVLTVLSAGVSLVNSDGAYNGDPYRIVPGVVALNPGQSATVTISFSNPGSVLINYTAVTYAGTFPPAPVTIACPAPTGTNGTAYSSALVGGGGILPYTYSLTGNLPGNLMLNMATGTVTGSPNANGPFTFTANVSDGSGVASGTASASCTITISPAVAPLTLSCPAPSGQVGTAYTSSLVAGGGTPSYTYSLQSGTLPTPLMLNAATGAITGTPNAQGAQAFVAKVVDSTSGTALTQTASCSIAIGAASTVPVTFQTAPAGESFTVDGTTYNTTQVLNWVPGSSHSFSTTSPQGNGGTRFVFNNWSNGGPVSQPTVTAPAVATTYTASFDTQFQLTTAASPANGGTVTPASGDFFPAGSVQNVTATANAGFVFTSWTGPVANANNAATTVTMSGPVGVTANFSPSSAITVSALPVGAGISFTVDGITYATPQSFNWTAGSIHTISTTTPQGSAGTQYVFNNWSDGGAISHSVPSPAVATAYVANFNTLYQLTTAASPANGGTVTPATGSFFAAGSVQNVTATPAAGFAFNGWTGPVANALSAATTVTLNAPRTVTANFVTALTLACPPVVTAPIGAAYSSSFTATGGTSAYAYSLLSGALPPPLTVNGATGLITGTPTTKGIYNFVGKVLDSTSPIQQSATASCSITVPNRPPTVTSQSVTTNEDTSKIITLAGADPDGDHLAFTVVSAPAHGTLGALSGVICAGTPSNCTASVTYTPSANYNGADSFTFKANDGTVDSAANATVSITINPVNDPPVAANHAYSVETNMMISIPAASGLLVGVTDPDSGDAGFTEVFTVGGVSATSPAGGAVTFVPSTGAFTFDPPVGFTGNITFTYTVCDNGNPLPSLCSAAATVTLSVAGPVITFVNPGAGNNGTGTLANPFNSLVSANTALGSNANQRIFVYSGTTAIGTGVTLNAGDWLVGQGVTGASFDTVMGITPPAGTIARPAIAGAAPIIQGTINMNGNNTEVLGLKIQPPSGSTGLHAGLAGPFTGLVVSDVPLISTTNARAVDLLDVSGTITIGKVSATSPDVGINLNSVNASGGSFSVTGTGGNCSPVDFTCTGGTITGATANSVNINNSANISLSHMRLNHTTHSNLNGSVVTGLTVDTCLIDGASGTDTSAEGALIVTNWLGTGSITNSDISGAIGNNVQVQNTQGVLNRLTISGTKIHDNDPNVANHGLRFATVVAPGAGQGVVMNLTVTGSTFSHHRSDHLDTDAQGFSKMDIVFGGPNPGDGNTMVGGEATTLADGVVMSDSDSSTVTVDFNGNNINGAKLSAIEFFQSGTSAAAASLVGKFRNNTIGTTGVAGSGSLQGNGLLISPLGSGTMTLNVTGNSIRQYAQIGIDIIAGQTSPHLNLTIQGNTVKEPVAGSLQGITLNAGQLTGDNPVVCANIGGAGALQNDVVGGGNDGGGLTDFRVRQRFSSSVQLPGYTGAGTDIAAVASYILARNTAGATANATTQAPGSFSNTPGGAACTQAP